MHRKCLIVMSIEFLGFLVEAVQFYEFHQAKHNKRSLKRGLIMTFNIENS